MNVGTNGGAVRWVSVASAGYDRTPGHSPAIAHETVHLCGSINLSYYEFKAHRNRTLECAAIYYHHCFERWVLLVCRVAYYAT